MKAEKLTVAVASSFGPVGITYKNAEFKANGAFLTITHDDVDSKTGGRMLTNVPLANIVHITESMPKDPT